jgi:hypothetical protein
MDGHLESFVEIMRDIRRIEQRMHRLTIGQGGEGSGLPAPSGTYSLLYSSNDYNASYDEWDGELVHPAAANRILLTGAANFSWVDATAAFPAPGSTKQVIYNNAGSLAGAAGFEYQAAASPNVLIQAQNAGYVSLIAKGAAAQTANLQEWQDSAANVLLAVDDDGSLTHTPQANSTTALDIQDTGAVSVLSVDTTNQRVNVLGTPPTSPQALNIYDSANDVYVVIRTGKADGQAGFYVRNDAVYYFVYVDNTDNFRILDSSARTRIFFKDDGTATWLGQGSENVTVGGTSPLAKLDVIGSAAATKGFVIRGAAAQTASLLELQESDGSIFLTSGDGLGSSEFVINEQGEDIDLRVEGDNYTHALFIEGSTDRVGVNVSGPAAQLDVDQSAAAGAIAVLRLDQGDDDVEFVDFVGTSAADQTKNISTVNGDGSVEGPKNFSASAGWAFEGMIRVAVNGTDYWMPYYSADTA